MGAECPVTLLIGEIGGDDALREDVFLSIGYNLDVVGTGTQRRGNGHVKIAEEITVPTMVDSCQRQIRAGKDVLGRQRCRSSFRSWFEPHLNRCLRADPGNRARFPES